MKTKTFIIVLCFIIISLIVYGFFPAKNPFEQVVTMIVFFGILPLLFNKIFLKRNLGEVGLSLGDWKQGLVWSGACLVAAGLIFFITIYFFGFLKHYAIPSAIVHNYKNFLGYEFIMVLPVIFLYDLFFRGFIMLTLKIKMYYWAIVIQALIFLILILGTKSLAWALVPYLIGAPLAGIIVYKSKSVFYSTAFQVVVMVFLDASVVRLIK